MRDHVAQQATRSLFRRVSSVPKHLVVMVGGAFDLVAFLQNHGDGMQRFDVLFVPFDRLAKRLQAQVFRLGRHVQVAEPTPQVVVFRVFLDQLFQMRLALGRPARGRPVEQPDLGRVNARGLRSGEGLFHERQHRDQGTPGQIPGTAGFAMRAADEPGEAKGIVEPRLVLRLPRRIDEQPANPVAALPPTCPTAQLQGELERLDGMRSFHFHF